MRTGEWRPATTDSTEIDGRVQTGIPAARAVRLVPHGDVYRQHDQAFWRERDLQFGPHRNGA